MRRRCSVGITGSTASTTAMDDGRWTMDDDGDSVLVTRTVVFLHLSHVLPVVDYQSGLTTTIHPPTFFARDSLLNFIYIPYSLRIQEVTP